MKKILGSLIAGLIIVFMFSTTVSAAQLSSNDIVSLVNRTNATIEQEIANAQTQAAALTRKYDTINCQLEKLQQMIPVNSRAYMINAKLIEESELKYDSDLNSIVDKLVETTNQIANETINIAAENGYTVICEMVEVQVGNRSVLIDPLRVGDI